MNAEEIIAKLSQLTRADKVAVARALFNEPIKPDKTRKFDLPQALEFLAKAPREYRVPLVSLLLEADKAFSDELSVDDILNLVSTLLILCQNHRPASQESGLEAKVPHDFIMKLNLDTILKANLIKRKASGSLPRGLPA